MKFKKKLVVSITLCNALVIGAFIYAHHFNFAMSQEEIETALRHSQTQIQQHSIAVNYGKNDARNIHAVSTGQNTQPTVLFIHGTPGSWDAYLHYLTDPKLKKAHLISYDRPGFGLSQAGRALPAMQAQADTVLKILDTLAPHKKAIIVGHSLGGPIAVKLAMANPNRVSHLVLVAPSVDPKLEKIYWYQSLAKQPWLSWAIPKLWRTTNEELLPLQKELEAMLPAWADLNTPMTIFHGDADVLVPYDNVHFIKRHNPKNNITIYPILSGNHFILWSKKALIIKHLLEKIEHQKVSP